MSIILRNARHRGKMHISTHLQSKKHSHKIKIFTTKRRGIQQFGGNTGNHVCAGIKLFWSRVLFQQIDSNLFTKNNQSKRNQSTSSSSKDSLYICSNLRGQHPLESLLHLLPFLSYILLLHPHLRVFVNLASDLVVKR